LHLGDDEVVCNDESLLLTVALNSGDELLWDDGTSYEHYAIDFSEHPSGEIVTVTAELVNSCGTVSDQISFEVEDCDIYVYVPNTFTPDGDELNQTFQPVITGENINSYALRIYNRWGQIVFFSEDYNVGWDGTFNGQMVQDGIYTWTIVLDRTKQDQVEVVTEYGHLTLVR